MLTFICKKEIRDNVIEEFVAKLAEAMTSCKITTLAANYYDDTMGIWKYFSFTRPLIPSIERCLWA